MLSHLRAETLLKCFIVSSTVYLRFIRRTVKVMLEILQKVIHLLLTVPGEPRKVRLEAINSTSVLVEWRSPANKERNGIIRGYQIHYIKVNDRDEPTGLSEMYDLQGGEKTEIVITSLQPDTWYRFQVAAYTRKGDGERSRPKTIKTKGAGR